MHIARSVECMLPLSRARIERCVVSGYRGHIWLKSRSIRRAVARPKPSDNKKSIGAAHLGKLFMAKKLAVVTSLPGAVPVASPDKLGPHGRALWDRIHHEYRIEDAGGVEMLVLACLARDRAAACRETIDSDGEMIKTKHGMLREHPLLRAELQAMAFCVKTLRALGLDVEPLRTTAGRPSGWGS
jgi:hypothetical protein